MFYVYRFLDKKKDIIYVGKSKQDLENRFRSHLHLPDACYDLTYKIEYIECATESDMSIKEIYYINKYRHDGAFFNVLDMADEPVSVEFNDKWKQYRGPLGSHFHHSINYLKGYTTQKEDRYNKDGTIDKRKPNKQKGIDSRVEGLTSEEVNLMIDQLIVKINSAENKNQEQLNFRNLVMFMLGVNLPLKANDFLDLKYCDVLDENDQPKAVELKLGRFHKDEVILVPIPNVAKKALMAYIQKYGLTYAQNADDLLFQSRTKHQSISIKSWWRIINETAVAVGITKNLGSESLKKTYGLNIYHSSNDKLNALVFLGELWGNEREGRVIKYLNLTDTTIDYNYYLGETFALGDVDLQKIRCLKEQTPRTSPSNISATKKEKQTAPKQRAVQKQDRQDTEKKTKANRQWPAEKKLEVVLKYLDQHIPQKELVKQYNVNSANISRWVNDYRRYGESVFLRKKDKVEKP